MEIYNRLYNLIKENNIKCDEKKLKEVCDFICEVYGDKKRYSDITLLEHTVGVAEEIIRRRLDDESIYAALLHETVKIEGFDLNRIDNLCNATVREMVETVARLGCLNYGSSENKDKDALRKMFLSVGKDIRTVIIKLIDRLYNMRNSKEVKNTKFRENMARESLYIYAPIADRLGMAELKSELEDLSFRILYYDEYVNIKKAIDEKKKVREEYINNRIVEIKDLLDKAHIKADVHGRPKHFYSIYKKIKDKGYNLEDLYDLLAIRIIVDSVKDCYSALGIVHDKYKPLPGRFKDYIASPKTNMYQSLHTTVFGEDARPFEIQIRTWDMHYVADYGVAAHFAYKEKRNKISDEDEKLIWFRKLLESQEDIINSNNNMLKIKEELFGEEVFVFTPKGDVISLPKGATPIDFAYSVHQKVAEKMVGAKVNSKMVSISTKLENTDIVEIITQTSSKGPSRDWLKYVKTTSAKNKIISFLKKQNKEENITRGKEIFEKELKLKRILKDEIINNDNFEKALKSLTLKSIDELYENIGFGSINASKFINKVEEDNNSLKKVEETLNSKNKYKIKNVNNSSVVVKNIDNCLIKFSKCCNPIPGDEIIGYITYSNGVSIHRKDCKNLISFALSNRLIEVDWKEKIDADFETRIIVYANFSDSVLTDVILKLKELKVNVKDVSTKNDINNEITINLSILASNNENLQSIIKALKKVDCVYDVKRGK